MAGLNDQKAFQLPTKLYQVLMLFKHKDYSSSVEGKVSRAENFFQDQTLEKLILV